MNSYQESKLASQAIAGDKESFALLYRQWVGKIYAYLMVRLGAKQDAEDITERVFLKAMQKMKNFQQKSSFATWVYAIARNELVDFYRRKKWQPIQIDLEQYPDKQCYQKATDSLQQQKQKRVEKILQQLPEDYRQVLQLRFRQNLSIKETAQVLGISENNVKVRTKRALEKARNL